MQSAPLLMDPVRFSTACRLLVFILEYLINIDDPPAAVLAVCYDGKIHQIICGISRPPEPVHRLLPVEICPKR
jgi:hypothetical protein